MINLRDSKYAIEYVTKEKLLELISDYDIFNHYIDNFEIGKRILSPLRNEKDPSFNVFWSEKNKCLLFKDFGGKRGDAIVFVQELLQIDYISALKRIAADFRLGSRFVLDDNYKPTKKAAIINRDDIAKKISNSVQIEVTVRQWQQYDLDYWNDFGIKQSTLKKYNVFPIQYIFINGEVIKADKYSYAYVEFKDGKTRYKIYQPYSKTMKWINNFVEGTISGFAQLPESGELLIITSSLKDGMCIHDLINAVFLAPQTENYIFKAHIINDLKKRFNRIIVFYDNDAAGIKAAIMMKELFDIECVNTGSYLKDPSDLYKYSTNKNLTIDELKMIVYGFL